MRPFFYYFIYFNLFFAKFLFTQETGENNPGLFESSEHIDPSQESFNSDKSGKPQKQESPHHISGGVTFISDYRSRGLSQSMCRPAIQGELTYTHKSGFYFKNWASNVDGAYSFLNDTCLEWDIYLGYANKVFNSKISYDVGFEYYYYPGGRAPVPQQTTYDTLEYYIGFSYGGFNIRLAQTLTDFYAVNSTNPPTNWKKHHVLKPNGHSYFSPYIELNYVWPLSKSLSTAFHIGYQGITNYSELSYFDWLVNVVYKFDWFDLNVMYVDTTASRSFYTLPDSSYKPNHKYIGRATILVGLSKAF